MIGYKTCYCTQGKRFLTARTMQFQTQLASRFRTFESKQGVRGSDTCCVGPTKSRKYLGIHGNLFHHEALVCVREG